MQLTLLLALTLLLEAADNLRNFNISFCVSSIIRKPVPLSNVRSCVGKKTMKFDTSHSFNKAIIRIYELVNTGSTGLCKYSEVRISQRWISGSFHPSSMAPGV